MKLLNFLTIHPETIAAIGLLLQILKKNPYEPDFHEIETVVIVQKSNAIPADQ